MCVGVDIEMNPITFERGLKENNNRTKRQINVSHLSPEETALKGNNNARLDLFARNCMPFMLCYHTPQCTEEFAFSIRAVFYVQVQLLCKVPTPQSQNVFSLRFGSNLRALIIL